jgi:hypothetical protein
MDEDFHQLAGPLVTHFFGAGAKIAQVDLLKDWERNNIWRVHLEGAAVPSVIAKQLKRITPQGYTDVASLRFLTEDPSLEEVAPQLYGASGDGQFYLMEDLGGSRSLVEVLAAGNVPDTIEKVTALGRRMGQMTAATLGYGEEVFLGIRREYPNADECGREVEARQWRMNLTRLGALAKQVNLALPRPAAICLQQIVQSYVESAGALAFSHGDPAPSNNHVAEDGRVRLIDFEYGAYRHVYYDLTGWFILCPLPLPWLEPMVGAFREELAFNLPSCASPLWHARQWATLSLYRGIAMLTWMPDNILEFDRPWVGDWSVRAAIVSTCLRMHQTAAAVPEYAPLAEFTQSLAEAFRARWPYVGNGAIQWPGA